MKEASGRVLYEEYLFVLFTFQPWICFVLIFFRVVSMSTTPYYEDYRERYVQQFTCLQGFLAAYAAMLREVYRKKTHVIWRLMTLVVAFVACSGCEVPVTTCSYEYSDVCF